MCRLSLIFKGMIIGIANIIPGLSGGTMAVVLQVYQRLIASLSAVFKFKTDFKSSFIFLLQIGVGAVVGIYFFSHVIQWLLHNFSEPVSYFFIGTILSSVPYIIKTESLELTQPLSLGLAIVMCCVGLLFVGLKQDVLLDHELHLSFGLLFVSSCVAAGAMIVPGISGSLVFVLFGTYGVVISAIKLLLPMHLLVISGGAIVGIFVTALTLNYVFKQ